MCVYIRDNPKPLPVPHPNPHTHDRIEFQFYISWGYQKPHVHHDPQSDTTLRGTTLAHPPCATHNAKIPGMQTRHDLGGDDETELIRELVSLRRRLQLLRRTVARAVGGIRLDATIFGPTLSHE